MGEKNKGSRRLFVWLGVVFVGTVLIGLSLSMCLPAWFTYGVALDHCPSGEPRQTLSLYAEGLRRGAEGTIRVGAHVQYTVGAADDYLTDDVTRFEPSVELVDGKGEKVDISFVSDWSRVGTTKSIQAKLPEIKDGDYELRAKVQSRVGESTISMPLPLYAPAKVHVLTDRPLYEAGQTVQFRSLVVRSRDLIPIDGRPGIFHVVDPNGQTVLEEKAAAGKYGVAASSFPIDSEASSGTWTVRWVSGSASGEASFRVEPFTLPRFTVEATPDRSFYGVASEPKLRGRVVYASGAPVSGARLTLEWSADGDWPPPTAWFEGGLPKEASGDAQGRFELSLPRVPSDLLGQCSLRARIVATDATGDRAGGSASLLLSKDAIAVTAVTEMGEELVEGFNNRLYLRVSTADGRVLPSTKVVVKRAWDPMDRGIEASTDEDGVAALQVDPGPPSNIVIPPRPVRPPPSRPSVQRTNLRDLLAVRGISLSDQIALDRRAPALEACARFVDNGSAGVEIVMSVHPDGRARSVSSSGGALGECMAELLSGTSFGPGRERMLALDFSVEAPAAARLSFEIEGGPTIPDELEAAVRDFVLDARACLPEDIPGGRWPSFLVWSARAKDRRIETRFVDAPESAIVVSSAARACVEGRAKSWLLEDAAAVDAIGTVRLSASASPRVEQMRPAATTMLGYELRVEAKAGDEEIGETTIRIRPGEIPPLRMRASPILAKAGETVTIELLRGPGFSGKLPEKLYLEHHRGRLEAKLGPDRTAKFVLPADAEGWYSCSFWDAVSRVFVAPSHALALTLSPNRTTLGPGETVQLEISTTSGGKPSPAAVGLFGVDETLAELAPLLGANALESLQPTVDTPSPAFGVLDGAALAMGRIRGENARAATVLRVGSTPTPDEIDVSVFESKTEIFEPLEPLVDHFYPVLAELHGLTRKWEKEAPKTEQMSPKKMAELWKQAVQSLAGKGEDVTDAFGRPLALAYLPDHLLEQAAPRAVVVSGTRLPEDVEDWTAFVRRMKR